MKLLRYLIILSFIISQSVFGVGEISSLLEVDEKLNIDPRCALSGSPMNDAIKLCAIEDESYDEFDVIECACTLPPNKEGKESFNKIKNKKIGNVFKNSFNQSKEVIVELVKVSSSLGALPDPAENNHCSIDALSEILKQRSHLPQGNPFKCGADKIKNNSKKYFGSDFKTLILNLGSAPQSANIQNSGSLFRMPASERNSKQCLSSGIGMSMFSQFSESGQLDENKRLMAQSLKRGFQTGDSPEDLKKTISNLHPVFRMLSDTMQREIIQQANNAVKNSASIEEVADTFVRRVYNKDSIQDAVNGMQAHCGFMMSSLADILCTNDEVNSISNNSFIENQLKHDPFEVDVENNHYYAAQSLYCEGQSKLKQPDIDESKNGNCRDQFRSLTTEQLYVPLIGVKDYDKFLACNSDFLGNENFIKDSSENTDDGISKSAPNTNICSFLSCSNTQELSSLDESKFKCVSRAEGYSLKEVLSDMKKVDCLSGDNNFCYQGVPRAEYKNLQRMLIMECRMTNCMADEELKLKLADVIKDRDDLKELIERPKSELSLNANGDQKFWNRFGGDTLVMASSDSFDEKTFTLALNEGFTGSGYKERKAKTILPSNVGAANQEIAGNTNSLVTDPNTGGVLTNSGDHTRTPIIDSNDATLSALNKELEMNEYINQELDKVMRQGATLAANPYPSVARDKALKGMQEAMNNIRSIQDSLSETAVKRIQERYGNYRFPPNRFVANNGLAASASQSRETSGMREYPQENSFSQKNTTGVRDGWSSSNNGRKSYARNDRQREGKSDQSIQDVPVELPARDGSALAKKMKTNTNNTVLDNSNGENSAVPSRGIASIGQAVSLPPVSGQDISRAKKLTRSPLTEADLYKDGTQKNHVIEIPADVEKVDVFKELINFSKKNPKFKLGEVIIMKRPDRLTGGDHRAMLIPRFDENRKFVSYGVSSDKQLRDHLILREQSDIKFEHMSRSESFDFHMKAFDTRLSSHP